MFSYSRAAWRGGNTRKSSEGRRAVTARPPSLYIELNTSQWATLSPQQRLAILETIGRIAAGAGYSGVQARTDDHVAVADFPCGSVLRIDPKRVRFLLREPGNIGTLGMNPMSRVRRNES